MGYDPAISLPTLVGSLLSCLATACVLLSYVFFAPQQASFRHALVFGLALTEFINSLNNSISGIYIVEHRHWLQQGPACQLSGFMNQLSVQAADFSILSIAVITFLTVIKKNSFPTKSWPRKIIICSSVWGIPLITSSIAVASGAIEPFSGNWCWISKSRTDLRYALGHSWRFGIIVATITMYIYMYIYIQRHFSSNNALRLSALDAQTYKPQPDGNPAKTVTDIAAPLPARKGTDTDGLEIAAGVDRGVGNHYSKTARQSIGSAKTSKQPEVASLTLLDPLATTSAKVNGSARRKPELTIEIPNRDLEAYSPTYSHPPSSTIASRRLREKPSQTLTVDTSIASSSPLPPRELFDSPTSIRTHMRQQSFHQRAQVEREVRRTLLLNAYPVAYVLLWIPGIANRLVEATTGSSPHWLRIMQSSTQYVGLANSLTYAFNEHMRSRLRRGGNEGYDWSWRRGLV